MEELIELTKELNEYAINYNKANEIIEKEDIIRAIYYIDNIYINSELDVLIFLASLNLFNSYAKQIDNHDIYKFKKGISTLIKIINEKNISNTYIFQTKDKGNLYIFQIGNIQFSFHDEKQVEIPKKYYKELKWDGIKKQPCSKSLFYKIIDNKISDMCITTTGKSIKILVNKLINDYHKNILSFEEILNNI